MCKAHEILSFLTKKNGFFYKLFWKTTNLKTIIFQYSKSYVTPTLVTRLNFAPNMEDLIRLNENLIEFELINSWRYRTN